MNSTRADRRFELLLFWAGILLMLGAWELLVRRRWISPAGYAAPSEIVIAAVKLLSRWEFQVDLLHTASRAMAGTLIGFPLGVLLALAIYSLGRAQTVAERMLDFIRSVPITALIPVFIGVWGIGERNKIAIGAFSAMLVTSVTVFIGLKHGSSRFHTLFHLYRPNYWKTLLLILIPYSVPTIFAALRLAVSSSLVLVVVAEMFIGTQTGVGKVINDMTYSDDRAAQYAAVFYAGILGYVLNTACEWLRRWAVLRYDYGNGQVRD